MISSRPNLTFNTITKSADAAISADPNSFDDSLGRLGHYEMLQILGRGGFGIVFRAFDDILQRAAGRRDPRPVRDETVRAHGARYIDFLIPGLIGMNLMSGSMWGIGWVLVNMRVRKLLKRLLAAPMRRRHLFYGQALAHDGRRALSRGSS